MADILLDNQAIPSTPASGKSVIFIDSGTKKPVMLDDSGRPQGSPLSRNDSIAAQGPGFAADTYVTGSGILIPSFGMRVGQHYRWFITVSKTAAGTAAAVFTFRIGSGQSTSDTSRLAVTAALAQTAALSAGVLICCVSVQIVSSVGVIAGGVGVAASAGLGSGATGTSGTFDNTALAGQFVGLSINGGASAAWTISSVMSELTG